MEDSELEVVAFDDEQKFAVGRALMAVADEVYECPKTEPITFAQDDVIVLLSDSDNGVVNENDNGSSDCEIFGEICTNVDESKENSASVMEIETPDAADVNINVADQNVNADATVISNIKYRVTHVKNSTNQSILHEIIELDDDDNDYINSPYNEDGANDEYSEEEPKEKKCVDLLDIHSDEDNQPSTSKSNSNTHNLEAFLNYLCPQCGVTCDNIKKWKAHTDIVHNFRSISTLNLKTVISREGVLRYQCNLCEKRYNADCRYGVLLTHRITHMAIPHFLRCRLCQERFSERRLFLTHFKKNHKKIALQKLKRTDCIRRLMEFTCPVCEEKAESYNDWMEHLEDDHNWYDKMSEKVTTIRDFIVECNTCSASFRSKQSKWHLLRHEKYKPFNCKICKEASSPDLSVVAKHIRVQHLKEQKASNQFLCWYCDKEFPSPAKRTRHTIEMHTIERLTCDVCRKKFNCSSRLLCHMVQMNHQRIK